MHIISSNRLQDVKFTHLIWCSLYLSNSVHFLSRVHRWLLTLNLIISSLLKHRDNLWINRTSLCNSAQIPISNLIVRMKLLCTSSRLLLTKERPRIFKRAICSTWKILHQTLHSKKLLNHRKCSLALDLIKCQLNPQQIFSIQVHNIISKDYQGFSNNLIWTRINNKFFTKLKQIKAAG